MARPETYTFAGFTLDVPERRLSRHAEHLTLAPKAFDPQAIDAFRGATELDPSYAPAHAGLALAHCAQAAMRLALPPMPIAMRGPPHSGRLPLTTDPPTHESRLALSSFWRNGIGAARNGVCNRRSRSTRVMFKPM